MLLTLGAMALTSALHASAQTPADQAPTNLMVTLTNGAVTLSWTAPTEDAASVTGYQILRRRPDEGESAFLTLAADTMSTSLSDVDATADEEGVRYEYQVQALRGMTASAVSNTGDLTLPFNLCRRTTEVEDALLALPEVSSTDCLSVPESQPAAITSLDLSGQMISSLQSGDFNGLTSLTELDLRDNSGLSYSPYLLNPLTSLTTLDGVTFTPPSAPGAPTGLTASLQAGNVELSWTAPAHGVTTSYQVLGKAGDAEQEIYVADTYDLSGASMSYTITGITEDQTYQFRVKALNARGVSLASDAVTVLAALVLTGPSSVSYPEESVLRVATFNAGAERPSLTWSLSGDDSADFSIVVGALRFKGSPTDPLDYESPADHHQDNEYSITVQIAEPGATSKSTAVTSTVTKQDEAGVLSLSPTRPKLGTVLTTTVTDPDSVVDGTSVYTWEHSLSPNSWAVIDGATASTCTPVAADSGTFLRATVTYKDGHGTGQTAGAVAYEVVTASLLTGQQVTTNDSTATPARALMPAFSADLLHYPVGCTNNDTMTVTPDRGDGCPSGRQRRAGRQRKRPVGDGRQ